MVVKSLAEAAVFSPARSSKADLFRGRHLFLGLNCFEAEQTQPVHTHEDADKFYFIASGKARMAVGNERFDARAGDVVWAPAGVPHGVERAYERTVMLVGIAPPPPPPSR
jgi:quercetin dioxygenase-like cupin family protein